MATDFKFLYCSDPKTIKSKFGNQSEFKNYLYKYFDENNLDDLELVLEKVSDEEMFEDCVIIKEVLDKKLLQKWNRRI